ncbi:MAG TPA: cyclopropane-fatty-acyl-phospholipid synthase family protein [Arenicellales bacterium]|nr:cyclopropane-fatty-acyl-phospholipid synthase family protein [Arenicellales bacterium]
MPLDFSDATAAGAGTSGRATKLEKRLMAMFLRAMKPAPIAVELWDGTHLYEAPGEPEITVRFKTRGALWGVLTNPDLNFGDRYSDGSVEVDGDLYRFIELASVHKPEAVSEDSRLSRLQSVLGRGRPRLNTMSGSRENIHHHYDLSNEFYSLWLDRDHMQYTCSYFPSADMTIEQSQEAKLHHVCRKLQLKEGDEVIEAGCGWGGLARFMAREYGARVRAYNISHQQIRFARDKAREEGLDGRVEYIEDDYRNARGQCDVFVSVGMLEHVGTANYPALGAVIDKCLRPDGRGLIHSIGRNRPRMMNRWIEKRIFPGAYPPTLKEMAAIFEPYNFSILDVENLRLHYALTLEHWLQRFEDNVAAVRDMFDERFVRAWRLYLTGSIAAFRLGDLQLFQVVFNRGDSNNVPMTREHLYI